MTEPDRTRDHSHPSFDIGGTITDTINIPDELFEVAAGKVFEDDVYGFVFRGEDGLEFDDVGVRKLL